MSGSTMLLVTVVATALAFDFTNGFHDTANAMATSIATRALPPRIAVTVSAALNFAGAFLSLSVAATVASGIVDSGVITLTVVFAGLVGAILWNLATWYLGIPSSSSHALIGGVIGATVVAVGTHGVHGRAVVAKVLIPALLAPLAAGLIAAIGTYVVYRIARPVDPAVRHRGFCVGQVGSASLVSLAHGTNDAQKTMGVITLALIAHGSLPRGAAPPGWVIVTCAAAIGLGTYLGGWRIIRTLGKGLVDLEAAQGFAAETAAASVILASSHLGYPLSTTHVCSGAVMGSGVGRAARVRWRVAGRLAIAWVVTLPAAALTGAVAWKATDVLGDAGFVAVFGVLAACALAFYMASRRSPVGPANVNDEWTGSAPTRQTASAGV